MVKLHGKGARTGVNLNVIQYDSNQTKDGKVHFLEAMVDARDPRVKDDGNLNLKSVKQEGPNGKTMWNKSEAYRTSQLEKIQAAAGDNKTPLYNVQGERVGTVYGVKANLMSKSDFAKCINTKSLEPSDFRVDQNTLKNNFDHMRAVNKELAAQKAEQTQSKQAQSESTQTVERAQSEPAQKAEWVNVGATPEMG